MNKQVISIPSNNDSFSRGERYALLAIETKQNYYLSYQTVLQESLFQRKPSDYVQGFVMAYQAEKEKRMAA